MLVAGCPAPSSSDAGTDVPTAPASDAPSLDVAAPDVPAVDAPAVDAPLDVPTEDAGECLAADSDCSVSSGAACCAPASCVPTGGAGGFRCIDETGCLGDGSPCGPGDHCCAGSACMGGYCVGIP